MALEIFVGRAAVPTASTGTTDFTSADSSTTPVGALHNNTKCTTTAVLSGDCVFNIGMSDGTTERAMSSTANDGQTASDVTCGMYDGAVCGTIPGNQSQDGVLNHNSFIAGGERVDNTDGFQNAGLNHSMFFAGCNYTVLGAVLNATVDTTVNVDPGHAWDVVLVTQCRETTLGDEDADQRGSFGFMTKADDAQASICVVEDNADASPGNQVARLSTTYAGQICNQDTGAIIVGIDVQEGSGTSCDIFPRLAGGELVQLGLTFIGFTAGEAAKIVTWDTPTGTGNNAVTGAGGTPEALIHLITRLAAYDSAETDAEAGAWGISFITDDSQFSSMNMNEFSTGGNSDCRNMSSPVSISVTNHAGSQSATDSYGSTHVSMDSDGWTENWTARISSSARKCVTLAITQADAGSSLPLLGGSASSGGF